MAVGELNVRLLNAFAPVIAPDSVSAAFAELVPLNKTVPPLAANVPPVFFQLPPMVVVLADSGVKLPPETREILPAILNAALPVIAL